MKILLIGPVPPPITGSGVSNQIILEKLSAYCPGTIVDCINTNAPLLRGEIGRFSWEKLFYYVGKFREAVKIFWNDKIYLTIGLTFLGVLKYAPYIVLSKIFGKEIILHIHSDYLWQEYTKLSGPPRWIFKTVLSLADKGIVLSPLLVMNLRPFLPAGKIFIVPNCVENNLFEYNLSQKLEQNFDKLRILFISNLMEAKGIFDLLSALQMLKQAQVPFEARLAGLIEHGMEARVNELVETLAPEVSYLGVVTGEAKKALLVNSNIFVLPTYFSMEGQPISILEAMATGNVVLTTEHAGIPDIFQDGLNGYYVEKQNPASIFEKLLYLENNLGSQKIIAQHNSLVAQDKFKIQNFLLGIKRVLFCEGQK
jgi:glycosyltransferase involved in cell wall biosynthesis